MDKPEDLFKLLVKAKISNSQTVITLDSDDDDKLSVNTENVREQLSSLQILSPCKEVKTDSFDECPHNHQHASDNEDNDRLIIDETVENNLRPPSANVRHSDEFEVELDYGWDSDVESVSSADSVVFLEHRFNDKVILNNDVPFEVYIKEENEEVKVEPNFTGHAMKQQSSLKRKNNKTSVSVKKARLVDDDREEYLAEKRLMTKRVISRFTDAIIQEANKSRDVLNVKDCELVAERTITTCFKKLNRKMSFFEDMNGMPLFAFAKNAIDILHKYPDCVCKDVPNIGCGVLITLLEKIQARAVMQTDNAHKVSNNVPHLPFSFAKWTDDSGVLHIHEERLVISGVSKPLGAAFDSNIGFIFTGNGNSIMSCSEHGEHVKVLVRDALNPSAIVIVRNGQRFAFLDDRGIHIYDDDTKRSVNIVKDFSGTARGLTFVSGELLVTAVRDRHDGLIRIHGYSLNGSLISTCKYGAGGPCFMTSFKNVIYISDLVLRQLRTCRVDEKRNLITEKIISLDEYPLPRKCSFPSGIAVDRRNEVLLVEANSVDGFILYGNAFLDEWQEVRISNKSTFPYTAAIAVSPNGHLLACCRRSSSIKLYRFGQTPEEEDLNLLVDQIAQV